MCQEISILWLLSSFKRARWYRKRLASFPFQVISAQKLHSNMSIALVFRPHTVKSMHHRNLPTQIEEKRNKCKDRKKGKRIRFTFLPYSVDEPSKFPPSSQRVQCYFSQKIEINSCFRLDYVGVEGKVLMNTKKLTSVGKQNVMNLLNWNLLCVFFLTVIMLQ